MTEEGRQFFFRKNYGDNHQFAAPGDTNPSDATGLIVMAANAHA